MGGQKANRHRDKDQLLPPSRLCFSLLPPTPRGGGLAGVEGEVPWAPYIDSVPPYIESFCGPPPPRLKHLCLCTERSKR